jgi:hypothetical protein
VHAIVNVIYRGEVSGQLDLYSFHLEISARRTGDRC